MQECVSRNVNQSLQYKQRCAVKNSHILPVSEETRPMERKKTSHQIRRERDSLRKSAGTKNIHMDAYLMENR